MGGSEVNARTPTASSRNNILRTDHVNIAAAGGRLIWSLGSILVVLGRGTGPRGEKMAVACPGVDSQDLATILDPFQPIFVDLGPDRLSAT